MRHVDRKRAQLDDAKRRYLQAKEDMEELREKIALEICPVKIGETLTIVDGSKEYRGVVEGIGSLRAREELLQPVVGAETGWAAWGHRIKKTTDEKSKWTFGINNFDWHYENKRWVKTPRTLEDTLGLAPLRSG